MKHIRKNYAYEGFDRNDEGWIGLLKVGYATDYDTISVFADTKQELLDEQQYLVKMTEEEWHRLYG